MSFIEAFSKKRQIIPRWHTFQMAKTFGGLTVRPKEMFDLVSAQKDHEEKLRDWKIEGGIQYAIDFLSSAYVLNDFSSQEALESANFLSKNLSSLSSISKELVASFMDIAYERTPSLEKADCPAKIDDYRKGISLMKRVVRDYPRDAIKWIDLAFFYSALGQNEQAHKCVNMALAINSNNRFILRSSSRFLLHIGEPDKALFFLRNSANTMADPWLIASEIAIAESASLNPQYVKKGKILLDSHNFSPFSTSELAGALGTLEFNSGSKKKGKKLFKKALVDPTENTVAQAVYLFPIIDDEIKQTLSKLSNSFEAESEMKFKEGDYRGCIEASLAWHCYQPFSSRPTVYGSYTAAVGLEDFNKAIEIAKQGLVGSPDDFLLNNNLAFSYASLGRVEEAENTFCQIDFSSLDTSEQAVYKATNATIEFRKDNVNKGRALYHDSTSRFEKIGDRRSKSLALYFWAREEKRVGSKEYKKILGESILLAEKVDLKEIITNQSTQKFHIGKNKFMLSLKS